MAASAFVRARIDERLKDEAAAVLAEMGLTVSDVVLINKIDTKSVFDFDDQAVQERILKLNPQAKIFFISAKTGEGMDAVCDWLRQQVRDWNA